MDAERHPGTQEGEEGGNVEEAAGSRAGASRLEHKRDGGERGGGAAWERHQGEEYSGAGVHGGDIMVQGEGRGDGGEVWGTRIQEVEEVEERAQYLGGEGGSAASEECGSGELVDDWEDDGALSELEGRRGNEEEEREESENERGGSVEVSKEKEVRARVMHPVQMSALRWTLASPSPGRDEGGG